MANSRLERLERLERSMGPFAYPPVFLEHSEDLSKWRGYPGIVYYGEDLLDDGSAGAGGMPDGEAED